MFFSHISRPHLVPFIYYTPVINGSLLYTAHLYCEDGRFTRQVGPSWQLNRENFTSSQAHSRRAGVIDVPAEANQTTHRVPWTSVYDSICCLTSIPGDRPPCSKMVPVNAIRLDLRTDTDSKSAIKTLRRSPASTSFRPLERVTLYFAYSDVYVLRAPALRVEQRSIHNRILLCTRLH